MLQAQKINAIRDEHDLDREGQIVILKITFFNDLILIFKITFLRDLDLEDQSHFHCFKCRVE